MILQIEPAQLSDISLISILEKDLYPQPWSQKDFKEILMLENFWFWAAKTVAGKIIGYLVCQVVGEEAELHNIAVAQKYQRQGIARKLLQKLLAKLKAKKIRELFLMVRASNHAAQNLYKNLGFKQVSFRKNYYSSPKPEDALIYRVDILA